MPEIFQRVRPVHQPDTGFFVMRLIKDGPLVPARICRSRGGWWAEISGRACDEPKTDPFHAPMVLDIWLGARREIGEAEYERLLDLAADRRHPASRPREKINLASLKSLF